MTDRSAAFFAYARERHAIRLRRAAGQPRPWTRDQILRENRFCCVFREDDKTTTWFRENVRDPLFDEPEVLLATVVFRMFNRIEIGEAIFSQKSMFSKGGTAFEEFLEKGDVRVLRRAIKSFVPSGPYTTGAYIISSPPGYSKLDGVLEIIRRFTKTSCEKPLCGNADWRCGALWLLKNPRKQSLRCVWEWLRQFDYLGKFHSYEIATDLRRTALLESASDADAWASVGPGARRGLNRIRGRKRERDGRGAWGSPISEEQALFEMRELLEKSRDQRHWPMDVVTTGLPGRLADWPRWEMREVEHTLCEFDKYERVRLGEGKPKGSFDGG